MDGDKGRADGIDEMEALLVGSLGPFLPDAECRKLTPGPTRLAVWVEDETNVVFVLGAARGRRVDLSMDLL